MMMGEVTLICIDTSSWMRCSRSARFMAQAEAIEFYCNEKIGFHPANHVGILAMREKVSLLIEPTRDVQKIMSSIRGARVANHSNSILDALYTADQFFGNNTVMYKRIVVFAGGPIYWRKQYLREIGIGLKEKGVAVDVVNFGDKNESKVGPWDYFSMGDGNSIPAGESRKENLEALVTAANHMDNSFILHVPEDQFSLRDHLSRSPILSWPRWEHSSRLESINTRQNAQIDALTQENEKQKREAQVEALVQENEKLKREAHTYALTQKNEKLKREAQIGALTQENEKLKREAQIDALTQENEKLKQKAQIDALTQENEKLKREAQIDALTQENEKLKREAQIAALTQENKKAETRVGNFPY